MTILGMPVFTFVMMCIVWPLPVVITAIMAFTDKSEKKEK